MSQIRILHVLHSLNKGGAETFLMNVYRNINRKKIQFDFVVHSEKEGAYEAEIRTLGGKIFRMEMWNGINLYQYKKQWKRFFKEHLEYNIVHGHLASTAYFYLGIAKKFNRITINHCHGLCISNSLSGKVKKYLSWKNQEVSDYYFTCSMKTGYNVYKQELYDKGLVKMIPNAIEVDKYKYNQETRDSLRTAFNISKNDFVVGHVGRFVTVKNHQFLLEVFNEVKKQKPNSKLLLVGVGELENQIKQKSQELGLEEDVIFAGVRSDVPNILSAMDVFVFPSINEGLGIVLVEAQTNGLKCFASDTIPSEVDLTGNVEFIPLSKGSRYWAEKILQHEQYDRSVNCVEKIKEAGYDISSTVQCLTDFYLGKEI